MFYGSFPTVAPFTSTSSNPALIYKPLFVHKRPAAQWVSHIFTCLTCSVQPQLWLTNARDVDIHHRHHHYQLKTNITSFVKASPSFCSLTLLLCSTSFLLLYFKCKQMFQCCTVLENPNKNIIYAHLIFGQYASLLSFSLVSAPLSLFFTCFNFFN